MPGGPVATGGGIGANGSKSKLAGIFMVSFFFHRAHFAAPFLILFSQDRFRRIRWHPIWL